MSLSDNAKIKVIESIILNEEFDLIDELEGVISDIQYNSNANKDILLATLYRVNNKLLAIENILTT